MSTLNTLPPSLRLISLAVSSALSFYIPSAHAEESEKMIQLAPIVVTGTRTEQNSFDLPIAIDVVKQEDIQNGQLQMTLSESLIRVPGITAQNRTQQAQDPQISSRGFGSRSAFGVRGVRVYVDGIPLTMPDGQGQPGVVDLSAIKSIEVMRGPFSALYGNSSGGVIQLFTQDAPETPTVGGTVMFGSYDTKRQIMNAAGIADGVEYLLNASNFESEGYRDNSQSDKQQATAKFKFNVSDDTKITTLINWFDQDAQDPIGLDRARAFNSNTRDSVVPAAINANTRVSRSHTQVGFNIEHAFDANNKLSFIPYVGNRENSQILPINALGTNARTSEISRDFYGSDLRWDNNGELAGKSYTISFGLNYGKSDDDRLDINTQLASAPANVLNRDEKNISSNFDQYVQAKLAILDNLDIHAGARHTKVKLEVNDNFITAGAGNGDNSGSVEYQDTTPVIGAVWKVSPSLNFYANFGKGFETPTFIEAAFNAVNNGIPNLSLKPSESRNIEIGTKAFISDNMQVNLTLFQITTDDEIIARETNAANRSVFANANKTKRTGAEFSVDTDLGNDFSAYFSYSLLNAKFDSDYVGASGLVAAGNRIPGTYRSQIYGELAWKYEPMGFFTAFEGRHNSKVYVNDLNTDSAPSYTIFNIRAGFEQNLAHWNFKEYLRVENMFDKEYIGSVRINDANLRFFEPAADRNYLLGLSAAYKF